MINYTPPTQHTSLFYNSEEEYLEIILPYFKAGLENNEFCLWMPPETLPVKAAQEHLRKFAEDLDVYLHQEQILIRSYESFYFQDGVFSAHKTMEGYVELEKKVLEKGFKGIRVSGDGTWALGENWLNFMIYEKEINRIIQLHKIRAICSYSIKELELKDICSIGVNHQSSLVRQMGSWNRLDSSKFAKTNIY